MSNLSFSALIQKATQKTGYVVDGVDYSNYGYKNLKDLDPNAVYTVKGVFITVGSQFLRPGQTQTTLVCDDFMVTLPGRYKNLAESLINSDEAKQAMTAGTFKFKVVSKVVSGVNKETGETYENTQYDIESVE